MFILHNFIFVCAGTDSGEESSASSMSTSSSKSNEEKQADEKGKRIYKPLVTTDWKSSYSHETVSHSCPIYSPTTSEKTTRANESSNPRPGTSKSGMSPPKAIRKSLGELKHPMTSDPSSSQTDKPKMSVKERLALEMGLKVGQRAESEEKSQKEPKKESKEESKEESEEEAPAPKRGRPSKKSSTPKKTTQKLHRLQLLKNCFKQRIKTRASTDGSLPTKMILPCKRTAICCSHGCKCLKDDEDASTSSQSQRHPCQKSGKCCKHADRS